MKRLPRKWLSPISLLLAMILYASSFVALKLAFQTYDPMVVIFVRMVVASVCFVMILRRFHIRCYRNGDVKYLLLMALCEPCLYFVFEARALENTTASQAGMISAMLPLLVVVGARFILRERVGRHTFAGFGLALFGVVWLSWYGEPSPEAPNPLLGNFFELLAMGCAAGFTLVLKRLSQYYHPLFLTALQAFIGSLFFLPFLFTGSTPMPTSVDPVPALSVLYLGIFVTFGAYALYNYGVSTMPANQACGFVNLIPVFTVILGWVVLEETFTARQCLASLVILLGVSISQGIVPVSWDLLLSRAILSKLKRI